MVKNWLSNILLYSTSVKRSKQAMITSTPCQHSHDTALDDSYFDTSGLRHATPIIERSYSDSNLYERHFRESSLPIKSTSTVKSFLVPIMSTSKMKTKRGKSAGVVFTSRHNLQITEEKEREKQMEAQLKVEQKRLREDKKKRGKCVKRKS